MKNIRICRANFSSDSGIYLIDFVKYVLSLKYNVIIDTENPDILFYSNLHTDTNSIDKYTDKKCLLEHQFPNCKKIFISGEYVDDYTKYINQEQGNYYSVGKPYSREHPNLLPMPFFSAASIWSIFHSCKIYDSYEWPLNYNKTSIPIKKSFCSIVQTSTNTYRKEIFNSLSKIEKVDSCGGFDTNSTNCIGFTRDEILDIKNKINFLQNSFFSLQIQSTNATDFTQEKLVHGFAANTIPVFYGNDNILNEGYNPEAFINCHSYESIEEVSEYIKNIYSDKNKCYKILKEPMFVDNKMPEHFLLEYLLSFLEKVINS